MADPLSITISVVTLIKVTGQASVLLHQFCIDVGGINATLSGLLSDVNGFQKVLEGMQGTFAQDEIKANLTGHAGTHWKNLARSLKDSEETLVQLTGLLESINKKTKFLDGPRKVARMRAAEGQIGLFREQIQLYRGSLQLSLNTVILWNQVTFQNSNEQVMGQIMPSLDMLFEEFRRLGTSLNTKIEKLQESIDTQIEGDDGQLTSMKNLRDCVRSAADVASTTSSTLTANKISEGPNSMKFGSDLGDVFTKEPDERMLRWISANVVTENETTRTSSPSQGPAHDQSDSDSDFEAEMIQALFDSANQLKEDGELTSAEKKLRSCLSLSSQQSTRGSRVTKQEILEALLDTYWMMNSWAKAKDTLTEKMAITERQFGTKDESYHWDTLKLATLFKKNNEHVEAQLQGRRALRGFRKLKAPGFLGYEKCLLFLIELCSAQEKYDEQDAYTALLASHQAKQNARTDQTGNVSPTFTSRTVDESVYTNETTVETTSAGPDLGGTIDENDKDIIANDEQEAVQNLSNPVEDLSDLAKDIPNLPTSVEDLNDDLAGIEVLGAVSKRDLLWAKTNIEARRDQSLNSIYSMLCETAEVRQKYSKHLELVTEFGNVVHGRNPTCASYLDEDGTWSCLFLFNDSLGFLATKASTESLAWKAVILQMCALFVPQQVRGLRHNVQEARDPFSDKVAIIPLHIQSRDVVVKPDLLITISIGSKNTSVYFSHFTTQYHSKLGKLKTIEEAGNLKKVGDYVIPHHHDISAPICGLMPRPTRPESLELVFPTSNQNSASWQSSLEWSSRYIESLFHCIEHSLKALLLIPWKDASLHYIFATSFALGAQSDTLAENAISKLAHNHEWIVQKLGAEAIVFDLCLWENVCAQVDIVIACEVGTENATLSVWSRQKDCVPRMKRVNYDLLTSSMGPFGQAAVDDLFEDALAMRIQRTSAVVSQRTITEITKHICQSAEYLDALAFKPVNTADAVYKFKVPKLDFYVAFSRTTIKCWLDEQADQLTNLVSGFLSRLVEEYPGRQVTHLLVYGESATLDYNFRYLRQHFDSSDSSVPNVKVCFSRGAPDDIAEGLRRQRMLQYDIPLRYA